METLTTKLFKFGILIRIRYHYWRAVRKLRAEEVGADEDAERSGLFRLGVKRLMPYKAEKNLAAAVNAGNRSLAKFGFRFPMSESTFFIPWTNLEECLAELDAAKVEFDTATEEYMTGYAENRETVLDRFERWAEERLNQNPEKAAAYRVQINALYPTPETLRQKFSFEWSAFEMQPPAENGVNGLVDKNALAARSRAVQAAKSMAESDLVKFFDNAAESVKGRIQNILEKVASGIEKGRITTARIGKIKDAIAQIRTLNFTSSAEMNEFIDKVENDLVGNLDLVGNKGEIPTIVARILDAGVKEVEATMNTVNADNLFRMSGRKITL